MPTVTVTGPDGTKYRVEHPEGATDAAILQYAQEQASKSRAASEPTTGEQFHGALSSFLDGAIPGAGGVLSGAAGAIMNPSDPIKGFTDYRKASEEHEERFKEDHPYLGALATGAGFVGSLALPVTKIGLAAKGLEAANGASRVAQAGLRGRALNGAANGALYGGVSGALSSHADNLGDFGMDALRGGVEAGIVGSALPIAGRLASPIAKPIAAGMSRLAAPAVATAGRMLPGGAGRRLENRAAMMARPRAQEVTSSYIGNKLEQTGMDPAALQTEIQRRQAMGVPAAPADTHEVLRDAYGSAARQPGPVTAAVRRRIDERQRQMSSRVSGHIGETLGPITNVEQQAATLNKEAREAARPLYDISDAQSIPFVQELQDLFQRPSGREALQTAGRELQDRGQDLTAMGLVQSADGTFHMGEAPTMPLYDHVKSALDEGIYAGAGPLASPEASRFGKGARQIRQDLLRIMDGPEAFPGLPTPPPGLNLHWRPAREAFAGPTQNRKAMELGQDMAKDSAVDAANRMENMTTGSQRDHFRLGHRTGLADDVRQLGDYGNAARRVNGNQDARDAISYVHGNESADALFDRLNAEHEGYQTYATVRGNSATAGRQASDAISEQEQAIADTGRGLWALGQGRALDAMRHFGASLSGDVAATGRVNELTAEALGSTDPAAVRNMLADVRRARVSDASSDAREINRLQQTSKVLGSRIGGDVATPDGEVLLGYGQNDSGSYYPIYGQPGTDLGPGYIPADL